MKECGCRDANTREARGDVDLDWPELYAGVSEAFYLIGFLLKWFL